MFFSSQHFKMLWIIAGGSPFDVKVSIQASHQGELTLRSSRSFIQPAMFDLEVKAVVGGWGGVMFNPPPQTLSLFLTVTHPSGANFFFYPAFHCHKIKDGVHNFRQQHAEHSPNCACSAGYSIQELNFPFELK